MKTQWCGLGFVLTAALLTGPTARATLLVYEGFGYPPGTLLDGASGSTGEIGFDGPWFDSGSDGSLGAFGHIIDTDDSFIGNIYNDIPAGGYPNTPGFMVGERRSDNSADRLIDPSITATFQDGTSTWFSYVSAFTNDGAQNNNHHKPNFAIGAGELLDNRADNANGQAIGAGAHKLQNGGGVLSATYWDDEDFDSTFEEHRSRDEGTGMIARAHPEQQLIVGRIDWGNSADEVSMLAFDISTDNGYTAPTLAEFDANAVSIVTLDNLDQSTFNTISVHGSRSHFDEIRIGTGFEDVVPVSGSSADCNGDGVVNAADLECVATIGDRDIVLGVLGTLPGDLNGNGDVAFEDFLVLSANFGTALSKYTEGDINLMDGVGFDDFLELSANFGEIPAAGATAAAVPEPSSLVLLGAGALLMGLARRRL